jgi:hypothetical protein
MLTKVLSLFFGCRHRRVTRPITPARRPGGQTGSAYVACLDCGKRFHYDVRNMKMGEPVHVGESGRGSLQSQP